MSEAYLKSQKGIVFVHQDLIFVLKMYSLDLITTLLIYYSLDFFIDGYNNSSNSDLFSPWGIFETFLILSIFFPFWETFFLQLIPIWLLKKVTSNNSLIILVVAVVFILPHFPHYDYYLEILLVAPGAIILTWSFLKFYDVSILKALLITTMIHAMFNFTVILLILIQ